MNKRAKIAYYSKINLIKAGKGKTFWRTLKPLFSSLYMPTDRISLVENETVLTDHKEIAQCFTSYFANNVKTLNFPLK